jgi:hypothetical protein
MADVDYIFEIARSIINLGRKNDYLKTRKFID